MGNVSSISQVFCFLSSAQRRMLTAGRKTHNAMGRMVKNTRMSADRTVKNGAMYRPMVRLRKTMMVM